MRTRLIVAFAAVLLAGLGTVAVLAYVRGADARALQGTRTVDVLVLTQAVPKNTPAKDLVGLVASKALPEVAVLPDHVNSLEQLTGKVATTDLVVGEQLLSSRFTDPATAKAKDQPSIPPGMQEVSIQLDPQRALGGQLAVGDTVGVFLSLAGPPVTTHLTLQKVLITSVQGGTGTAASSSTKPAAGGIGAAPAATSGGLLVTLAVTAPMAERVVFAAEHGTIWLSKEPASANGDGTAVITPEGVFK